jgi:hypothetical protein
MTATEPHADVPSEVEARSLDDLVSDCVEVTRHLAEVPPRHLREVSPPRRTLTIPDRAVGVVADLDSYGD